MADAERIAADAGFRKVAVISDRHAGLLPQAGLRVGGGGRVPRQKFGKALVPVASTFALRVRAVYCGGVFRVISTRPAGMPSYAMRGELAFVTVL